MRIRDILKQKGGDVVTIDADRTVHDAICQMNEHRIGALVVTEEGTRAPAGIVTERDVLQTCGERCSQLNRPGDPCPAVVRDVMTSELVIGVPEDRLDYVMGVMTQNRVRHLPVLEGAQLVGIISIGDVVRANLQETRYENRTLRDYIHGAVSH